MRMKLTLNRVGKLKALDAGIPVTSAQWMQEVTVDELDTVLKSDSGPRFSGVIYPILYPYWSLFPL